MQSAGTALHNDTFVRSGSKSIKKNKKRTNVSAKQAEEEEKDDSVPFQEQGKSLHEEENSNSKKNIEKDDNDEDAEVLQNDVSVPNYSKAYAKKIFKSYSGYITIEQENIPRRLNVTKGSYVQFNLTEKEDAIWHFDLNEDIGKIILNKVENGKRTLVIMAIAPGNTRLFLDNISVKDNNFRSLFSKDMLLMVD